VSLGKKASARFMISQDKAIQRFRRQLAMRLVLKYTLPLATVWALGWGIAVLVLRAAAGVERLPLLGGLAGVAGCVALAILRTRRRMPANTVIRALLDEQSRCGGLLMAGEEQELGRWRRKMPDLALPRIQWDGRRAWALLVIAAGFVLLSFLAPQGLADLSSRSPFEIDREVARLIEQIALLKAEAILEPARADLLKEKLAEVSEHASGKDPARMLEALDHLRSLAGKTAREAAEQRTRQSERLTEAEALAEVLRKGADMLSPKLKMEALTELADLMDKSRLDLKRITKYLDPQLMKSVQDKLLNPEQLKKLAKVLHDNKVDLARQVEKMHKAGLIDAELLSKCQQVGACDSEALRAFLKKNKGRASLDDLKSLFKQGDRGETFLGPGEAPLTWRKPSSGEEFKFKEEVLSPGALASLQSSPTNLPNNKSAQIVLSDKPSGPALSGALQGAAASGGSANTEMLLPRHRAAVENYFERKSEIRNPKSERKSKDK
jgi:hypothetical protein